MKNYSEAHGNGVQGSLKVLLAALLLIILIPHASALSITEINAPNSVKEGETLYVNFTTDKESNQSIYRNDELVSQTHEFEWKTNTSSAGSYSFKFEAIKGNQTVWQEKVVEVFNSQLTITINTPPNEVVTDEEIRISVTTDKEADTCTYQMEDSGANAMNGGPTDWYKSILLGQDKVYNLTIECSKDGESRKKSRIFILDTTPPSILSKTPEGSHSGTPIPMEVETNENSLCRYARNISNYEEMKDFSQTGGTDHKQIIQVKEQKDYTYNVKCRDRHGNEMEETEKISFFANLKPTAKIRLEGEEQQEDLLKPGTYEVKVTTSEPVTNPTLQFEYSKERNKQSITLEGSGTEWEGFIPIKEDIENDVGTFYFKAEDLTGLEGREITQGKIFLVDTQEPEQVESIKLERDGIDVKVEWSYEGEPVDHFEIYRSTEPDVDRLEKWAETPQDYYLDQNIILGKRYYYRVAAVDKAGNIGMMSPEKHITLDFNKSLEKNDPKIASKLNQTKELLQKKVFEVENSIKNLEKEKDNSKQEVIRYLNLLRKAREAKHGLETLMKEIDKLQLVGLTEKEADKRIEVFLNNAENQMKKVAKNVEVLDSTRQDQVLFEENIEEAINEVLVGVKLTKEQKSQYEQSMKKLQDQVTVNMEAITAKVQYHEQSAPQDMTIINKQILAEPLVREAVIVEKIPKQVARQASEISFKEEPAILKRDPIVKWEQKELTTRNIQYHVNKIASLTDVQSSKTVVLEKPEVPEQNEVTGAVAGPEESNENENDILLQAFLFIGMIASLGLTLYYVAYVKDGEIHQTHRIVPQQKSQSQMRRPSRIKRRPTHPKTALELYHELKKGHYHMDNVRYEEAMQKYKQILDKMETEKVENLEDKYRKKLEKEIKELYEKLMLITNVKKAHHAIDTQDLKKLKDTMIDIKKTYHELDEETELTEHVRNSYSYFINHLKGLDRDEFFKNLEL